jgi:DNA gyrase/topoisomerase IV subunit A
MVTPEKVEEWLKEIEARPGSAALIVQFIANRLRDLSERNAELLAENIALTSGKRVEEYERRIAHLEYQLELIKRQLGGELPVDATPAAAPAVQTASVLLYDDQGRVLRLEVSAERLAQGGELARLAGERASLLADEEPPRLLAVPSRAELLAIFSSGRVATFPAASLAPAVGATLDWAQAAIPDEPRAGETLAGLVSVSRLALAEYFLQVSRRGCVKKIRASLAESILANHYIGSGIKQAPDRTFELALCAKEARLALVSSEGYLLGLETKTLPFAVEEALKLNATDHLVAAFVTAPEHAILIMTQVGKLIHWEDAGLESAASLRQRGQAVFSPTRRAQGVRVVGAAAASAAALEGGATALALHAEGQLTAHLLRDLVGAGTLPVHGSLLAFTVCADI